MEVQAEKARAARSGGVTRKGDVYQEQPQGPRDARPTCRAGTPTTPTRYSVETRYAAPATEMPHLHRYARKHSS